METKSMSKDQKNICLYCKWWRVFNRIEKEEEMWKGDCRRYAPRESKLVGRLDFEDIQLSRRADFPWTYGGDWCGEFEKWSHHGGH